MKKSIKLIIVFILGGIFFMTAFSYASSYNSEEISYDTSTSGAVQANVKDALDFLYNKTKAGGSAECPENMSCILKPGVVMNVTGPGTVDKGTVYVGIGETNTFTVTPNSGYALHSITCNNGYTLSSFSTVTTSVQPSLAAQTITITNPNTANGATCQITFGSNEITIQSIGWSEVGTNGVTDTCNSASVNCACYYIKNGGSNFSYNGHTGCNFKSKTCKYTYGNGASFNCATLDYPYSQWVGRVDSINTYTASCSGVITCAT